MAKLMSEHGGEFEEASRTRFGGPYTAKHPVPTVHGFRRHCADIKEHEQGQDEDGHTQDYPESRTKRAYRSVKGIARDEDQQNPGDIPYPTANRNYADRPTQQDAHRDSNEAAKLGDQQDGRENKDEEGGNRSATEVAAATVDPKEKRKVMKKQKGSGGGRSVTDPITHLPLLVHDLTERNLKDVPENEPVPGERHPTLTGGIGWEKSQEQLEGERHELDRGYRGMRKLFRPPNLEDAKHEMMRAYRNAVVTGLASVSALGLMALLVLSALGPILASVQGDERGWLNRAMQPQRLGFASLASLLYLLVLSLTASGVVLVIQTSAGWLTKRVDSIFEGEVWHAAKKEEEQVNLTDVELPESVAWLNSLFASVWPLINPDLFASVVDMLEDVMQASLPKVVRMVSVEDIGQGSEAFRILGIKWLPTGAASRSVNSQGKIEEDGKRKEDGETTSGGMEAEEGDFINMELAFAYRVRSSGKSIKSRARNAHLYLKFHLPGGIAVPVWMELRGLVGVMRLRLQLTPDPPFFSLCTLTFIGQPKADLACVPISKRSLNLMDVPLISGFVQSSIDAALAEYVAPKSLTLDLKEILMGDDFKKDTAAQGVILVLIKSATDFKEGDGGFGPIEGSSDSYVTVSWGKFGKSMASTRIIVDEQKPVWNEWAAILVSPEEVNADETLRLQLRDSDKHTADDDLGRVETPLKQLMRSSRTKNQMCDRTDELTGPDPDEKMPGKISWSVGFFTKIHIQQSQLAKQQVEPDIRSREGLQTAVTETAKSKLREAKTAEDASEEQRQQTVQDFKAKEDEMITSTPPPEGFHSGILSIQIHNITGLEVSKSNKSKDDEGGDREEEGEGESDLPDSYCNIILNHRNIFRTRTKPKNGKPFFNAGTERFVKDWKTSEVMISVRDNREGEKDPLLGVLYLPLARLLKEKSQVAETYPLAGGIGHGRARISMVWRSVKLKLAKETMGWDYGTLEIKGPIKTRQGQGLDDDTLTSCKLKLKTKIASGKMKFANDGWRAKHQDDDSIFLGVTRRYASALLIKFQQKSALGHSNPALAVLWLSELPDEEEKTVTLRIWKGGKENVKRASTCGDYDGLLEGEQPLGELNVTIKFWRGLSGYHKDFACKPSNREVANVMEVLDVINDENMTYDDYDVEEGQSEDESDTEADAESVLTTSSGLPSSRSVAKRKILSKAGGDSSSSESSNEDPSNPVKNLSAKIKSKTSGLVHGRTDRKKGSRRGPMAQIEDYKNNQKQLHRKHRGIMQWKTARTLDWMKGKVDSGRGRLSDMFEHDDNDQVIETEV